jgi:hypothetical protein
VGGGLGGLGHGTQGGLWEGGAPLEAHARPRP